MRKGLWDTYNAGQDEERLRTARCPECGSDKIIEGDLMATAGVAFVPAIQETVVPRGCGVRALACRKCGAVFGLRRKDKKHLIVEESKS